MKILFLQAFPLWGGGSGVYTRELATKINHSKNFKTGIVCSEPIDKLPNVKIYTLEIPFPTVFASHPQWPTSRLYKDLSPREISDIFRYFLSSVVKAVEDFKPDLIHVQHVSILLWVASFIKSLYGINFIVTVHGSGVTTAIENKIYIPHSQEGLRKAKYIVAVSRESKNLLIKTFGKDFAQKTKIIAGGVNLEDFPIDRPIKIIDKKYKIEEKKVVLFSGRLSSQKGVEYLVRAAKHIHGDIYIVGDGPEKKSLEDLSLKLNLSNMHFLGYMGSEKKEELKDFYYRADVLILPVIKDEALGLSVIEAMAAKTPIVATNKGGTRSVVKEGVNGFLIKAKNSKEIADACNKILDNDDMRKKMGEMSRKIVEDKFTWEKMALKLSRLYKNITKL